MKELTPTNFTLSISGNAREDLMRIFELLEEVLVKNNNFAGLPDFQIIRRPERKLFEITLLGGSRVLSKEKLRIRCKTCGITNYRYNLDSSRVCPTCRETIRLKVLELSEKGELILKPIFKNKAAGKPKKTREEKQMEKEELRKQLESLSVDELKKLLGDFI